MKIRRLDIWNINAFPNIPTVFEFTDTPSLVLISGENGTGKTSIREALSLGIYGKVAGKSLKDLANRANHNGRVIVHLESNGKEIVIDRSIEPSSLSLKVNGVPYTKAGARSVQEYIEDDLLEIPFHVFNNVISLSVNDFKSFVKMSPVDKRQILDKIFGLHVVNEMKDNLKKISKTNQNELQIEMQSQHHCERSIESSESELSRLKEMLSMKTEIKKSSLVADGKCLVEVINFLKEKLETQTVAIEKLEKKEQSYRDSMTVIQEKINAIIRKQDVYKKGKCPTCENDLSGELHKDHVKTMISNKNELTTELNGFIEKREKIVKQIKSQRTIQNDLRNEIADGRSKLKTIQNSLDSYKAIANNDSQTESIENLILQHRTELKECTKKIQVLEKRNSNIRILDEMLSEGGVKQMAMRSLIPEMNKMVSIIAHEVGFPFKIQFDQDFNAVIIQGNQLVPVNTLSTGQTKRADLAVLLCVIRLLKSRYPSINLLFLDEIMSSVDSEGRVNLLKILRKHTKELGINVVVVNHTELPRELFDIQIQMYLDSGFSRMKIIQ